MATWHFLSNQGLLTDAQLLSIEDEPSEYRESGRRKLAERLREFRASGGRWSSVVRKHLLEPDWSEIEAPAADLVAKGANVVLDVSTLPKRFFFPMLKLLFGHRTEIPNLVVTYTVPQSYTTDKLAKNLRPWDHLPAFAGPADYRGQSSDLLIVAAGFEPFGLVDEIGSVPTKILFPFPARARDVHRAWEFVRIVEKGRSADLDVHLTDPRCVSDTFDWLLSLTNGGQTQAELAPFGSKAMSVAMCLFASLTEYRVSYTQPGVYHPDYSAGVGLSNGVPMIFAYWIRSQGIDFYELPPAAD